MRIHPLWILNPFNKLLSNIIYSGFHWIVPFFSSGPLFLVRDLFVSFQKNMCYLFICSTLLCWRLIVILYYCVVGTRISSIEHREIHDDVEGGWCRARVVSREGGVELGWCHWRVVSWLMAGWCRGRVMSRWGGVEVGWCQDRVVSR